MDDRIHTAITKSEEGLAITYSDADGLRGRIIGELVTCGIWKTLKKGEQGIIGALCAYVRVNDLTRRGEPIVYPSQSAIREWSGFEEVTVRRGLQTLARRNVISVFSEGKGNENSVYVLHFATQNLLPNLMTDSATLDRVKQAKSASYDNLGTTKNEGTEGSNFAGTPLQKMIPRGAHSEGTEGSKSAPRGAQFEGTEGLKSAPRGAHFDGTEVSKRVARGSDTLSCSVVVVAAVNNSNSNEGCAEENSAELFIAAGLDPITASGLDCTAEQARTAIAVGNRAAARSLDPNYNRLGCIIRAAREKWPMPRERRTDLPRAETSDDRTRRLLEAHRAEKAGVAT